MKQLKEYMAKIEATIASSTKTKKPRGSGLLSAMTDTSEAMKPTTDIEVIAAYVAGIRKAKEELNGNV